LATALTIASDRSTRLEGDLNFSGTGTVNIQGNVNFLFNRVGVYRWGIGQDFVATSSTAFIGFSSSGTDIGGTNASNVDTRLFRDAANTLALRNGVNAQTFNVYNTFTDASNYERGVFKWSSNVLQIGAEALGTGTGRAIRMASGTANPASVTLGNATIEFNPANTVVNQRFSNTLISFGSTLPLGWSATSTAASTIDVGLARNAAGVLRIIGSSTSAGASVELIEQTAPAAPAADGVRIYAEDDGAGKTRLMARFATGAAQQIAIEP
jgi:hypothetical protein